MLAIHILLTILSPFGCLVIFSDCETIDNGALARDLAPSEQPKIITCLSILRTRLSWCWSERRMQIAESKGKTIIPMLSYHSKTPGTDKLNAVFATYPDDESQQARKKKAAAFFRAGFRWIRSDGLAPPLEEIDAYLCALASDQDNKFDVALHSDNSIIFTGSARDFTLATDTAAAGAVANLAQCSTLKKDSGLGDETGKSALKCSDARVGHPPPTISSQRLRLCLLIRITSYVAGLAQSSSDVARTLNPFIVSCGGCAGFSIRVRWGLAASRFASHLNSILFAASLPLPA